MKITEMLKRGLGIVLFLTFVLAGLQARAVGGKIQQVDGTWLAGEEIRFKKTTGEYIVTVKGTDIPLPKNRVKAVVIDKPAAYDQAAAAVSTGAIDQAIPMLEQLATECFLLSPWDARVLNVLGAAYKKKGDKQKAAATYKKLLGTAAASSITMDMQRKAWEMFIAVDDKESLRQSVDAAITGGTRENAAAAHIARADMAKAQGNKQDAMLDYLRVVILYEQVKSLQAEALYKVTQCLEELRDPRAEDFRKKLIAEYPQDPWAVKK